MHWSLLVGSVRTVSERPIQVEIKRATYQFRSRRIEEIPPVQNQLLRMGSDKPVVI